MTATLQDIRGYVERGQKNGSTHVIIACDTFDHDNYPVFVSPEEKVQEKIDDINKAEMQRVDEVYNLQIPIEPQLQAPYSYNL